MIHYRVLADDCVGQEAGDRVDYTPLVRAQIFYNHLFFSDLPQSARKALVPGRRYWDVINQEAVWGGDWAASRR